MKNFSKKIIYKKVYALYLSVAFFFMIFSFGNSVLAANSYSSSDTSGNGNQSCSSAVNSPCGFSLTPSSDISVSTYNVGLTQLTPLGNGLSVTGGIWEMTGSLIYTQIATSSNSISVSTFPNFNAPTLNNATFNYSSPVLLLAGHYYLIGFYEDTGGNGSFIYPSMGTQTSGITGLPPTHDGDFYKTNSGGTPQGASNYPIQANFTGGSPTPPIPPDITSRPFLTFSFPSGGYSTTTQTLNFNVQGFSYGTSTVTWTMQNLDTGYYYQIIYPQINPTTTNNFNISTSTLKRSLQNPNASCGISTGSSCQNPIATTTLEQGGYTGSIIIQDELGQTDSLTGLNFIIGTTNYGNLYPPSTGIILPGTDFNAPTSTTGLSDKNLLSFLNIPELLKTKFPFAYLPQLYSGYQIAIGTSTQAASLPTGTMNFEWPIKFGLGTITTTTISIDAFSTTTITYYLKQNNFLALIRGILVAILYWELAAFIWHDIRNKRHMI